MACGDFETGLTNFLRAAFIGVGIGGMAKLLIEISKSAKTRKPKKEKK